MSVLWWREGGECVCVCEAGDDDTGLSFALACTFPPQACDTDLCSGGKYVIKDAKREDTFSAPPPPLDLLSGSAIQPARQAFASQRNRGRGGTEEEDLENA